MELSSNHLIVFDACSLINLFYIDYEHEVIFKNLNEYFDFYFPEKVKKEVKDNRLKKADKLKDEKRISKAEYKDLIAFIDARWGELYNNVIYDYRLNEIYDPSYFDDISKIIGFRKNKGEWYCVALSFFLSRYKETRLSLITDDFPAKKKYKVIVQDQKIGCIEDTSDILFLMYWNCPDFDHIRLKKVLQDLYSEYQSDLKDLLNKISKFRINKVESVDKDLNWAILEFEDKLKKLNLEEIEDSRDKIITISGKYKDGLKKMFNNHKKIFEASSNKNFFKKIKYQLNYVEDNTIFRIY